MVTKNQSSIGFKRLWMGYTSLICFSIALLLVPIILHGSFGGPDEDLLMKVVYIGIVIIIGSIFLGASFILAILGWVKNRGKILSIIVVSIQTISLAIFIVSAFIANVT